MKSTKCPVCGETWPRENADATVQNIAHLVEDHSWTIKHALAFIQHPDRKLDPVEVSVEIDRLRGEVHKLNTRIAWLRKHTDEHGET